MDKPKRGRPSLDPNAASTRVSYYFTRDLLSRIKARAHDLRMTDSEVIRKTLEFYLHLLGSEAGPDRVTLYLEDTDLGKAVQKAAKVWELPVESIMKMALLRGLSDLTKEGETLKKGLAR